MKIRFDLTIEVDGKWSRAESKSALTNQLAVIANQPKYKADVAMAAHLMICSALGIAGSVGISVKDMLKLDTKVLPKYKS